MHQSQGITGKPSSAGSLSSGIVPTSSDVLKIGIVTTSAADLRDICSRVEDTGLAQVGTQVITPGLEEGHRSIYQLVDDTPDIVIMDLESPENAVRSLQVLEEALPKTRLFFCCAATDPQLLLAAMRSGARDFLSKPVTTQGLHDALARFLQHKERQSAPRRNGRVYSVISAKGGAGATSVAINLAFGFKQIPETTVALVDLARPMSDVSGYLNLSSQFNVQDALAEVRKLDTVLLDSYMTYSGGVSVLPGVRERRPGLVPSTDGLTRLYELLRGCYDHTVVDLSSSPDREVLELIARLSSNVVVVLTPELPCMWRSNWLIRLLSESGAEDRLRLIVNRSRSDDPIGNQEIERTLFHAVFWNLPNNYTASIEAVNSGKPLISMNNCGLADSYLKLAHKMADIPMRQKRGALASLFKL